MRIRKSISGRVFQQNRHLADLQIIVPAKYPQDKHMRILSPIEFTSYFALSLRGLLIVVFVDLEPLYAVSTVGALRPKTKSLIILQITENTHLLPQRNTHIRALQVWSDLVLLYGHEHK